MVKHRHNRRPAISRPASGKAENRVKSRFSRFQNPEGHKIVSGLHPSDNVFVGIFRNAMSANRRHARILKRVDPFPKSRRINRGIVIKLDNYVRRRCFKAGRHRPALALIGPVDYLERRINFLQFFQNRQSLVGASVIDRHHFQFVLGVIYFIAIYNRIGNVFFFIETWNDKSHFRLVIFQIKAPGGISVLHKAGHGTFVKHR